VIDASTRDRFTITDSRRNGSTDNELFIPMPSLASPATGTLDVWITNASSSAVAVTVTDAPAGPARRRAVRRSTLSEDAVIDSVTLAPAETRKVTIASAPAGHVRLYSPRGAISATGRLTSTAPPRTGMFGTGIPALPASAAAGPGERRQFSLADDQPGFSPPSLLLLETSGQPATVRVTMRFSFPGGQLATGQAETSRDYVVPAGQRLVISDVSRSVIGNTRDSFGRLFKIVFDVEVISDTGRVLPYLQIIDPSGDVTLFSD
jgi:hypothetical protein